MQIRSFILVLSLFFLTPADAHIWILDINDTITLRNDVDPEKTVEVVNLQLVAQNSFLKDDPGVNLEAYIKKTIPNKTEQRATYGNLLEYAQGLFQNGLISEETLNAMPALSKKYRDALAEANKEENGGFFPSLFRFIDYILAIDPGACISIQSFGDEIPMALDIIRTRYQEWLQVDPEIGRFDDQNRLVYQGKTYESPDEMLAFLKPRTVVGWRPNYKAGGRKLLFLNRKSEEPLESYFFDDNADRFAGVLLDGITLPVEQGYEVAKNHIFKVDTGQALTDEHYFINLYMNRNR